MGRRRTYTTDWLCSNSSPILARPNYQIDLLENVASDQLMPQLLDQLSENIVRTDGRN